MKALRVVCCGAVLIGSGLRAHAQMITNSGFEHAVTGWEGITAAQITTADAHSGTCALRLTSSATAAQGWIALQTGHVYVASVWFKWHAFGTADWGFNHLTVVNDDWSLAARLDGLHQFALSGQWTKCALTFTATHASVRVELGVFGPQVPIDVLFDDVALVQRITNAPPTALPSASVTNGAVPLTVFFSANADDPDGAIAQYAWEFGDGAAAREAVTRHTFVQRGTFDVRLRVWDNDGASVAHSLVITVTNPAGPHMVFSPAPPPMTTAGVLTVSGYALPGASPVVLATWDNLRMQEAGRISLPPAATQLWSATIPVACGSNTLLFTVVDAAGRAETLFHDVYHPLGAPVIANVTSNAAVLPCFGTYVLRFLVATEAPSQFFRYDPAPPAGVQPGLGLSVDCLISGPHGVVKTHPAFWARDVERAGSAYVQTTSSAWHVRFTPSATGTYHISLAATDARGSLTHYVGRVVVTNSGLRGFVVVATNDPRYFAFMNGGIFWPAGPVMSDYASAGAAGLNFTRPWLAGRGVYSANWSRWISSAEQHGNEGFMPHLSFRRHGPHGELAQHIFYPEGYRMWLGYLDEFAAQLQPGQQYQLVVRVRCEDIAGPYNAAYPWGFTVRTGGWPGQAMTAFWNEMRARPALVPHLRGSRPWHTLVTNFTAEANPASLEYIFLYLDNVTNGAVFIDYFSIRPVQPGGALGGELVRNPLADWHTYVEQRPAAFLDDLFALGAQHGIFHKCVVQDKHDWIPNHLTHAGIFTWPGHGYFQPAGTKAAWLQEQWWRYLVARWGYAASVHSWELCNEGPPTDSAHWRRAQEFGEFLRRHNTHPQLKTTSFWATWQPAFWGNTNLYPDIDYADIHTYVTGTDPLQYDMVAWHLADATNAAATPAGKPVVRAETGIYAEPGFTILAASNNPGVWYHNLLWAQLSHAALFDPGYWFSEHFARIPQHSVVHPFARFVELLPLHQGGYTNAAAASDNPLVRALGQKNVLRGHAVLWLQNVRHTWRNVMGIAGAQAITPQNATVTVRMAPHAPYLAECYNTYTGGIFRTELLTAGAQGDVVLEINGLRDDVAVQLTFVPEPMAGVVGLLMWLCGWHERRRGTPRGAE